MWWEPTTENDERVAAAVNRIAARMREGVNVLPWLPPSAVTGVGSILIAPGFRLLLLALDVRSLLPLWPGYEFSSWWWHSRWKVHTWRYRRKIFDLGRTYRNLWYRRLIPLMDLPISLGVLREMESKNLDWSDIPDDTIVLLAEPPEPLLRGVAIRSGQGRGSVGLAVEFERAGASITRGYTTAGHVIEGTFVQQRLGLLEVFRRSRRPDTVVVAANSARDAKAQGYDIAVIASPASLYNSASLTVNGVSQPSDIDADSYPGCAMLGGVSGIRYGYVVSAMKLQRGKEGEVWEHCWIIAGERGWIAKQGDSGAAVMLHGSAKVLGHLVAGVGSEYRGRFELGWVQDIRSQLTFLDHRFGIILR